MIVTIAVLGILVLIAAPKMIGYVEKAELTRIQHDTKVMEQEMELAMLDDEVSLASWDDNAKDLGALILRDQLYEKEGFAERIDKSHLERRYGSANLANYDNESQLGVGGAEIALSSDDEGDDLVDDGYKIIPKQYKSNIKTRLGGTFYTNELGKVYYEHDKPLTSQKSEFIKACESPVAEDLGYTFNYETMTIEDYDHREQHLVIPASFKNPESDECVPVRIIGEGAFMIGGYKSVVIPQSVQRIEREAFLNKNNEFTEINIPHSVNYIGENAFTGKYIESVTVNRKQGTINYGNIPFYNTTTNTSVTPSYRQPSAGSIGYTFDRSRGAIVSVKRPKDGVLTIPESVSIGGEEYPVRQIDKGAFQGLGLISVVLPNGLERIEDYAFSGNQLVGVTIPDSVVHVGNYAFSFNEQTHSLTGKKRATIKSVIMKGEEQFDKIDQYGDILDYEGGPKVDLFAGELRLLDHIFVTSIGNHVVDEKYVGGEQKESEEGSETSPNGQDGPIVFNGLGPEAFDGDENTRVNIDSSTQTLKWEGDLSNREIVVSGALNGIRGNASLKFTFFNGNNIVRSPSFPNIDSITYSKNGSRLPFTFSAIVPKGADSFKIEGAGSNQSNIINEIYSPSELRHVQPQTVNVDASDLDITLSWEFPQRVIIIKNDVKLEEGIMNSYTDKPLHPNTQHNYKVLFIDEYGNGSNNFVTVSEFTKDREIVFSGLDPEAWDRDISTGVNIDSSTRTLKWEGNLNGRILRVDGGLRTTRGSASLSFTFYNGENVVRSPSFPNSDSASYSKNGSSRGVVFTAVVPDEADRLVIKGAGSNQTIMIDEVSVVD